MDCELAEATRDVIPGGCATLSPAASAAARSCARMRATSSMNLWPTIASSLTPKGGTERLEALGRIGDDALGLSGANNSCSARLLDPSAARGARLGGDALAWPAIGARNSGTCEPTPLPPPPPTGRGSRPRAEYTKTDASSSASLRAASSALLLALPLACCAGLGAAAFLRLPGAGEGGSLAAALLGGDLRRIASANAPW